MADNILIESVLITEITEPNYHLLKLALKVLGKKFSHFDSVKIYDSGNKFEIITTCAAHKYMTRTYVGKHSWRILESYCKMAGEEEIEIYKKKK